MRVHRLSHGEMEAIARQETRRVLIAAGVSAERYGSDVTLGSFVSDTHGEFELYVSGDRREQSLVLTRTTVDRITGGVNVEIVAPEWKSATILAEQKHNNDVLSNEPGLSEVTFPVQTNEYHGRQINYGTYLEDRRLNAVLEIEKVAVVKNMWQGNLQGKYDQRGRISLNPPKASINIYSPHNSPVFGTTFDEARV